MKSAPPAAPAGTIGFGFPGAAVGAIPFVFPFAPLGLGLFDADPQRLLTLLQHQSALAEEALRYRNLLFGTVGSAPPPSSSPPTAASLASGPEDCKEVQHQQQHQQQQQKATTVAASTANSSSSTGAGPPSTIRVRDGLTKEGYRNGMGGEELLLLRKLPNTASPPPAGGTNRRPSSCASDVVCDESLALFRETPGAGTERELPPGATKCHICMAHFPSVWLLEQHSALQHPHLTLHDDKPYQCGLCGQKSRYSCCRYRTVLGKHQQHRAGPPLDTGAAAVGGATSRSRVPADKLFTCDVCGMQFRYLKSFKKHRLNHALERLHGKKGTVGALVSGAGSAAATVAAAPPAAAAAAATVADSEPAVSSTNEQPDTGLAMTADAIAADLRGLLRDADALESADDGEQRGDEQDDTVSDSHQHQHLTGSSSLPTVHSMEAESSSAQQQHQQQQQQQHKSHSHTLNTRSRRDGGAQMEAPGGMASAESHRVGSKDAQQQQLT
uniref:Uncharacterized protein n=1 Tax=Anopheles albimanus TaxID=7167 RepID=A0A182FJP9_ANOAL